MMCKLNNFSITFQGIASFISIAHDLGICVAVSEKVSRHSKPNDFDRIIERLSQKPQARAVVMFVDEDNTRYAIRALYLFIFSYCVE